MTSMTTWNPWDGLTSLHRDLDRMFGRVWGDALTNGNRANGGAFVPASELVSDENAWHVRLVLPGVDPKDVNIEVSGNILTVSGERRHETKGEHGSVSEIAYGRFERRFTIPERVDVDKVEASYRHGILELTLPLEEAAKPRRIAITANEERQRLSA